MKRKRISDRESPSTISTVKIKDIVERLRSQRCRDSTRATYHRIWKRFNRFFIRLDDKPDMWEDRLILFIGYLIEECKLQSSTIKTYILAIKGVLAENKIELNLDRFLINSLTRACRIRNDSLIARIPIQKPFLNSILDEVAKWCNEINQPYLKSLYQALFSAAYYGLLRIGEVTKGPHVVLAHNIRIGVNKDKLLFILRSSKTHNQGNGPQLIKISSTPIKGK